MHLKDTPEFTMETIKRMEDMSFFEHAQIFDDLLIVAQKETNCFVLQTTEGLIVIDAIWPDKRAYQAIIDAIKDTDWDPKTIKKVVFTHGHVDHMGCGRYFIQNHGTQTYLSKTDETYWIKNPTKPDRPETWKDFDITNYVDNGDKIILGETQIQVLATPGHTPGCLSYIFPVHDNGELHMAALFGGATPLRNDEEGTKQYLKSLDYFVKTAEKLKVDVALTNHTIIDNGHDRINYAKKRLSYMPNIYILGEKGHKTFCNVYKTMGEDNLE